MSEEAQEPLTAEFDTVASWTAQVVKSLGAEYAIPAACRGSAHPEWLSWVAERLALEPGDRFLDAGAGLGGPSAWLAREILPGLVPVLAEPMVGACQAARSMFGLPTVGAWSQALPFGPATFDAAWSLGVLCTTTQKRALLGELRRVLTDQGRLGLLVLVQASAELPDAPEGNDFPTGQSLLAELKAAGFTVDEHVAVSASETADDDWQRRVARVEKVLAERYGDRPGWQVAHDQESRIGRLLGERAIETWLLAARVSP